MKDGKVEGKSKTDGVCWWKVRGGNSTGGLVGIKGSSGGFLADIANLKLGEVTVLQGEWNGMGEGENELVHEATQRSNDAITIACLLT